MYRCAVLFNSDAEINNLDYFNLNDHNITVKLYKLNNDYYLIIEGEASSIEFVIKMIEMNKVMNTFEMVTYYSIKNRLLERSVYQKLDIDNREDYPFIKMIYDVKDNIQNISSPKL